MKTLLAKCARRKALGLYLDGQKATLSVVAETLLGPVEVVRRTIPLSSDQLGERLRELMSPWIGRDRRVRLPVAVGLPPARVFFATQPLRRGDQDLSGPAMLQRIVASPTFCVDDFVVELQKSSRGGISRVTTAACGRKYLTGLLTSLEACGVRPFRVEPAPCALLRVASRRGTSRKAKVVLRIFLGATQGLIVLLEGPRPVAWRSLPMVRGAELGMIVSVVRMLNVLRPNFGMERPIDVALIHGRMDLSSQLSEETLRAELGVPVIGCEQPDWAPDAVAYGLAVGCLTPNAEALDLAGSLKPQPRLREIFPWGELAVQTAILACMAMLLVAHSNRLAEAHAAAKAEARKYSSLATASVADLKQEEKDLQGRVEAIERFLSSRVIWTAYTHDLANRLPPRTTFTSLQGLAELESPGKRNAAKRSLRVEAAVPVQADGTMPPEIDEFLDSLRGHSMLEREFGAVELNLIKVQQKGEQPMASLSIVSERGKKKATPAREEGR